MNYNYNLNRTTYSVLYMHNSGIWNNFVTNLRSLRQENRIIFNETDNSTQTFTVPISLQPNNGYLCILY